MVVPKSGGNQRTVSKFVFVFEFVFVFVSEGLRLTWWVSGVVVPKWWQSEDGEQVWR